jgi:hypothetical protein
MKLIHNYDRFMKILHGENDKTFFMVKLNEEVRWSKQRDIVYNTHAILNNI